MKLDFKSSENFEKHEGKKVVAGRQSGWPTEQLSPGRRTSVRRHPGRSSRGDVEAAAGLQPRCEARGLARPTRLGVGRPQAEAPLRFGRRSGRLRRADVATNCGDAGVDSGESAASRDASRGEGGEATTAKPSVQ